jgi:thiosulfate/3-mercaptopyruvate sulfurtransferase
MKKLLWLGLLGLLGGPLHAVELPGPLVNGEWLVENRDAVVVLDVRKETGTFADGHIPGAVPVDVTKIRIERGVEGKKLTRMRPDPASFEKFMRDHGVDDDSIVVISHPGDQPGQVAGAARLYWHLKYYGFDRVALLDGGNPGWVDALEDLVTGAASVTPGNYSAGPERAKILATMEQVRAALGNDSVSLIDTRDLRQHIGLKKKDYVYAPGHIPGSDPMPYKFLHSDKGSVRFLETEAYTSLLDKLRIDTDKDLIVYCNSGYEASSSWFVLHELLGFDNVRLYDGSLHQWTQYAENPMTTRLND